MSPNSEGRTVSPGTASNSNTVTRAFAWESNRITPEAHTLSQPAGPLDGLILGTGFWAQFPAQIWDRVPCTSQKNGSEKVSPFRTQNETATQQAILSHVPEKVAKQILAVWPELPPPRAYAKRGGEAVRAPPLCPASISASQKLPKTTRNGQLQPAKIVHAFEPYRVPQNGAEIAANGNHQPENRSRTATQQ
jgi:hypothetical protein